jgi:SAM-dependent methyltransferase
LTGVTTPPEAAPREQRQGAGGRKLWNAAAARRLRGAFFRSLPWLRGRDLMLRIGRGDFRVAREDLARRYLFGEGIEIGPMTKPLRVPPRVVVRYVDRLSRDDLLRLEGPALTDAGSDPSLIPEIHVVDEADRLATFADDSVDFVVANHVVEHLEDPLGALEQMLRITRPGGVLLLTLPDARHMFDAGRARTTVEHVLRDHEEGPQVSRREHYEEWARHIEGASGDDVRRRVEEFAASDARHHFHVWELGGFLQLLLTAGLPCEIVHAQSYLWEFAVVLRSLPSST